MATSITSTRAATLLAAIAVACAALPAIAAESATATIASTQLAPTLWQYDMTLTDTGTTPVGTFWFAWIPGQDYMPTQPNAIVGPGSWTAAVTHAGASDGYAIQWVAGAGAAITPGQSLAFSFDSATTPQQMAGNSALFPATPVLTSFIYSGAPFSDPGVKFLVQAAPVPEPASLALLGAGLLAIGARVARRRSPRAGTEAST